jgi:hypothetical protein
MDGFRGVTVGWVWARKLEQTRDDHLPSAGRTVAMGMRLERGIADFVKPASSTHGCEPTFTAQACSDAATTWRADTAARAVLRNRRRCIDLPANSPEIGAPRP